jgi:type VI secretion system protein ImpA
MAIDGLDLEALLAPISDDAPAGADVRADASASAPYFNLRVARSDARADERAADSTGEVASPEGWRTVRNLAVEILTKKAKDLEVAAWLTESLVRSNGLEGLAFCAELMAGLVERYWDDLFPTPEDGPEDKTAPVTGLNGEGGDGTLVQPLNKTPLFKDAGGDWVLLFQYAQSAELETITDKKRLDARLAAGVVPFDKMQSAARAYPPGNYAALRRNVDAAQANWRRMGDLLDEKAGAYAPPTGRISEILQQIADIVKQYGPAVVADAPVAEGAFESVDEGGASEGGGSGGGHGGRPRKLNTREDALASLAEIAEYFRRAEPQSPIAYTIDDAIRRSRLTWPELLAELVSDESVRKSVLVSLGIRVAEAE